MKTKINILYYSVHLNEFGDNEFNKVIILYVIKVGEIKEVSRIQRGRFTDSFNTVVNWTKLLDIEYNFTDIVRIGL